MKIKNDSTTTSPLFLKVLQNTNQIINSFYFIFTIYVSLGWFATNYSETAKTIELNFGV